MNSVTLTGYLSENARGRKSSSGPYATLFTVAVNDKIKTASGIRNRPMFFECIYIGGRAQELEPQLKRGALVDVRGDFIQDDMICEKLIRVKEIEVLDVAR